jgi:hypothetical protein
VDTAAASGHVALVASNPTTWWILQPGPKSATAEVVVTIGAIRISSFVIRDLPKTTNQMVVAALNARDALITLPIPSGYHTTYETANGGVTWSKVTLPVPLAGGK